MKAQTVSWEYSEKDRNSNSPNLLQDCEEWECRQDTSQWISFEITDNEHKIMVLGKKAKDYWIFLNIANNMQGYDGWDEDTAWTPWIFLSIANNKHGYDV